MPKNRKDEHVALAESFYQEKKTSDFDAMQFVHHSLPEINIDDISLSTSFSTLNMENPFYINAMTGGSDKTKNINAKLSEIAKETDIAIASGSQSAALNDSNLRESFTVLRKNNPNGIIFANVGAERSLEDAKSAVDMIEANALQLHINVPQELVMPEGSRQFSNWLSNIEKITSNVGVPVIAKEVGFGMSSNTIQKLIEVGVHTIDVGGSGGTNFIQIENARRQNEDYSYLMDWGQSTPISLLEAYKYSDKVSILGSGGIRNPLDIIKALSLRAKAVGIAGIILHHLNAHGPESTVNFITDWKEQLKVIMCLLGTTSIPSLDSTDVVLLNPLVNWCEARDIKWKDLAKRQSL